jgi:predicted 3-demethylubiquinone-9 3-methyltransferase (glyoxalase superfamily)
VWLVQRQVGGILADNAYRPTKAVTDPDPVVAKRAFDAMMEMGKIDIAAIERALRG